jgi:FkbM family methyltransferase
VDGGACLGDTALLFSNCVGPNGRVYAFDPVEDHLLMCLENTRLMAHQNVSVLPVGLAAENVDAPPIRLGGYAPGFNAGSQAEAPVPVRTLDHLVASGEIERMDFIKLDIEGAELDALRGGVQSIRQFRPKMAISLYHKPNDLFEIIQFVAAEFPFYELHLDHYTIHREETVLYCLPTGAGGH